MGGKSTFSSGKEELKKYKENKKEIMKKHRRSHCIKLEMKIETEE